MQLKILLAQFFLMWNVRIEFGASSIRDGNCWKRFGGPKGDSRVPKRVDFSASPDRLQDD
jgi:hypothetical protein